jgi:murein DD-endopeptidase MepM/ murein hydrolase activator NlpD
MNLVAKPQTESVTVNNPPASNTTQKTQTTSNAGTQSAGLAAPAVNQTQSTTGTQSAGLLSQALTELAANLNDPASIAALSAMDDDKPEDVNKPKSAPPDCDATHSPFYCVYTIKPGDTLSSVATRFGIKGDLEESVLPTDILVQSNKPDIISEDDLLQIEQKLRIPLYNGVLHTVLRAETLSDIATRYGVTVSEITGVSANGISNADALELGKEILIPNPKQFALPVVETPAAPTRSAEAPAAPTPAPSNSGGSSSGSSSGGSSSGSSAATTTPARSSSGFIWPVGGPISSYFGPGHPLGIDIDLFNNRGAAIASVAAGTVTFAGGNPCCSYGYYVIVDHGGGIQTLYAHFSSISVSVGQKVSQGQSLGIGGRTGYATGDHLHFEVHVNGAIVNPLSYLP